MIWSLFLYWAVYGSIIVSLVVVSSLKIVSDVKKSIQEVLLVSVFVYLSWNLSNWIWNKFIPSYIKEKVDPTKKAVFITGCDTGFGHELAKKLDAYGFIVYAGCLNPSGEGAKQLKKDASNNLKVIRLDVTKEEDVVRARQAVDAFIGENDLWAIVNNAGILASTEIEMGSMDCFTNQIDVNSVGLIRVTKAFLPLLRKSKGRVINVASLAGRFSIPGMVGYCVSKAAVISFSEGLRREMKKWAIDVITVEPHLFNTNLVNNEYNHRVIQKAWDETPEEIRADYGDVYFAGYKNFLNKVLGSARPRISHVVETMFTAVTEEFVGPSYLVMGDLEALRVWMWSFWPTRALDFLSYYAAILQTGQPIAKIKAVYEKKKIV